MECTSLNFASSDGELLSVITNSDIAGVVADGDECDLGLLEQPASSYVTMRRMANINDAAPTISVAANAFLESVLTILSSTRVHRLFVVDSGDVPIGLISLSDLLRWLSK